MPKKELRTNNILKDGHVTVRAKRSERICPAPDQEMPSKTCSNTSSVVSYFSRGWKVKPGLWEERAAASGRAYRGTKCKYVHTICTLHGKVWARQVCCQRWEGGTKLLDFQCSALISVLLMNSGHWILHLDSWIKTQQWSCISIHNLNVNYCVNSTASFRTKPSLIIRKICILSCSSLQNVKRFPAFLCFISL